jgi:hypothetical protein
VRPTLICMPCVRPGSLSGKRTCLTTFLTTAANLMQSASIKERQRRVGCILPVFEVILADLSGPAATWDTVEQVSRGIETIRRSREEVALASEMAESRCVGAGPDMCSPGDR